ncbi:MAG: hypothetical protein M1281_18405 [Chloroflexi bacterium]|nr:hypothetical protein [Chloroflexota bacterium]
MENNPGLPSTTLTGTPQVPPGPAQQNRGPIILAGLIGLIVIAALVAGIVLLAGASLDTTARVRDIFIIFMALEFLVIGIALIVLMVQLATLINLLQNEVKPILESTTNTVNTLRGTAEFLSDNLVEPVIKLNEYVAALRRVLDFFHLIRH